MVVLLLLVIVIPFTELANATLPSAFKPIQLPETTLLLLLTMLIPSPELPLIKLRSEPWYRRWCSHLMN